MPIVRALDHVCSALEVKDANALEAAVLGGLCLLAARGMPEPLERAVAGYPALERAIEPLLSFYRWAELIPASHAV